MTIIPGLGGVQATSSFATLKSLFTSMGVTPKLILDMDDPASWPGSGSKLLDASGNGYDFYYGTSANGDTAEPSQNGISGQRGNYLGFDGGDYLLYDAANETWMNNLHKNNAKWSFSCWLYYGANANAGIFGTSGATAALGVTLAINSNLTQNIYLAVGNGTSDICDENPSGAILTVPTGEWTMISVSVDEAGGVGGSFMAFNDNIVSVFDGVYASPSASNAARTMQIGARGNNSQPLPSGSRLGMAVMFEGSVLSQGQVKEMFHATRNRYSV